MMMMMIIIIIIIIIMSSFPSVFSGLTYEIMTAVSCGSTQSHKSFLSFSPCILKARWPYMYMANTSLFYYSVQVTQPKFGSVCVVIFLFWSKFVWSRERRYLRINGNHVRRELNNLNLPYLSTSSTDFY